MEKYDAQNELLFASPVIMLEDLGYVIVLLNELLVASPVTPFENLEYGKSTPPVLTVFWGERASL
jgi:hypothetical protein